MREPLNDKKRLEHNEYFRVDCDTVWAVIHSEIVELKEHVSSYLSSVDWDTWEKKI